MSDIISSTEIKKCLKFERTDRHKLVRETKPSKLNSLPTVPEVVVLFSHAGLQADKRSRAEEETVAPVTKCTS